MNKKFTIGILGAGALGSFFGAKLTRHYHDSDDVQIIFLVREKSKPLIETKGMKIISSQEEFIVFPKVTSNASDIPALDLLIIATKTYDLEEALKSCLPAITSDTFILPLQNGVNAYETIAGIVPGKNILSGFVYIVASLVEPAVVKVSGETHSLNVGSVHLPLEQIERIASVLRPSGINTVVHENITKASWQKFFFISTMATITSYLNKTIHEITDDVENRKLWIGLIHELKDVATSMQIPFNENILDITLAKGDALPAEATTSMYRDFKNNNRTEVESLTGYVVKVAEKNNVAVPIYKEMYDKLCGGRNC